MNEFLAVFLRPESLCPDCRRRMRKIPLLFTLKPCRDLSTAVKNSRFQTQFRQSKKEFSSFVGSPNLETIFLVMNSMTLILDFLGKYLSGWQVIQKIRLLLNTSQSVLLFPAHITKKLEFSERIYSESLQTKRQIQEISKQIVYN